MALLPSEVWVHVFGYLSTADKLNVRTCCKYFKNLVDNPSLWRDTSVVLSFLTFGSSAGKYNAQFWATLRRWKINSVVMQSTKAKDWKQLALSLPALNSIVMDDVSQESLDLVKTFTNLRCLAIRHASIPVSFGCVSVCQPSQLTHLSVCNVHFCRGPGVPTFRTQISQYTNLTSLIYHQAPSTGVPCDPLPCEAFHSIIGNLPKLKHLSCSMNRKGWMGYNLTSQEPCAHPCGLTSLEIIDYMDPTLSKDIMRSMPCLQRLAVYYRGFISKDKSHLKTWLTDLCQLSELVIVRGPPPHEYMNSVPDTVTSLRLRVGQISSQDMETMAARIPNLLHLNVYPLPAGFLGSCTDHIPQLFPQLRSLTIRHGSLPDNDLLSLHRLQHLERLEILDDLDLDTRLVACARPHLLVLQILTNDRVKVITSPFWRDLLAGCDCSVN